VKRQHGVGLTVIITEFDLVYFGGEGFDDRAHLSSKEVVMGEVFLEGDDVEEVELGGDRGDHVEIIFQRMMSFLLTVAHLRAMCDRQLLRRRCHQMC
jgi:hypothetical protein